MRLCRFRLMASLTCLGMAFVAHAQDRSFFGFEVSEGIPVGFPNRVPADAGSIQNQWTVATAFYDVAVTAAAAHSGAQSLRWSNKWVDSQVDSIMSPRLRSPAGEPGTHDGLGIAPDAGIGRVVQQFYLRTVAATADPGLDVNIATASGLALRMSIISFYENAGQLKARAIYQTAVGAQGTFADEVPVSLQWGAWYLVRVEVDMKPGPLNDVVRVYIVPEGTALGAPALITHTYEQYYASLLQPPPAVNRTSMRISQDAGGLQPAGVYLDDLSLETMYLPPDPPDAGLVDAGVADAGGQALDAGLPDAGVDAGIITVPLGVGCGCRHASWWAFAPALLVLLRRRR